MVRPLTRVVPTEEEYRDAAAEAFQNETFDWARLFTHGAKLTEQVVTLQEELEVERMRLAACMTAALGNTAETVAQRITPDHPYFSASYRAICDAVDREMALRAQVDALEKRCLIMLIDAQNNDCPVCGAKLNTCSSCGQIVDGKARQAGE